MASPMGVSPKSNLLPTPVRVGTRKLFFGTAKMASISLLGLWGGERTIT